ncbi:MAG: efflux RND transporter periplasmic adaptor subunit [Azoarcus sp.]|jgi:cobalt-zinc-cadmium efflux system membrane fusion protein|nr:efflux RND transporter periplasmic adaptor subunit [Azoarcus sp.]
MNDIFPPWAGALILGLSASLLAGCGDSDALQASSQNATSQTEHPMAENQEEHGEADRLALTAGEIASGGIRVETLAAQEVGEDLTVTATIRPNQDRIARVSPRVPGRIVRVNANLGEQVRANQTLAVLDSLEVGEAHSDWRQASARHAIAKADAERAEKLHAEQIIARKDHLRAQAEFEQAKAALAAAGDRLRMLGVPAGAVGDGKAISTFPLTTPFAGTIIEKQAITGEPAQPDRPLFTVADLSTLWIEANLFEKDLGRVRIGADAAITVAAYPGQIFAGTVTYIAATVDKETRTVQARVEVPNPDGRLKPEMFATAAISTQSTNNQADTPRAIVLPEEAVVLMQSQPTVFVEEHGGFEARAVELGEKLRGKVVVKNGLAAGDKAVIAGAYAIKARIMKSQLGEGHGH